MKIKIDFLFFANLLLTVKELRDAAKPFTSGDVVVETTGTVPVMERLEDAIKKIDNFMPEED